MRTVGSVRCWYLVTQLSKFSLTGALWWVIHRKEYCSRCHISGCLDSGQCRNCRWHKRLRVINHKAEVKSESQRAPVAAEKETASHCRWRERRRAKETIQDLILSAASLHSGFILNSDCQGLGSEWEAMEPWVNKLQKLKSLIPLSFPGLYKSLTPLFCFYYPRLLDMCAVKYDSVHLHFSPLPTSASSHTCLPLS